MKFVFDIRAETSLPYEDMIETDGMYSLSVREETTTAKQSKQILRVLWHNNAVCTYTKNGVRLLFRIWKNLAVSIVLGTLFIERFGKRISHVEINEVQRKAQLVPILVVH